MGWPQYTYFGLAAIGLGIALAKDGEPRTGNHSFFATLLGGAIAFGLLYAGGFFG